MQITVRQATIADMPSIEALLMELRKHHCKLRPELSLLPFEIVLPPLEYVLLAIDGLKVVGMVHSRPCYGRIDSYYYIENIIVASDYQRKGIASILLKEAIQKARKAISFGPLKLNVWADNEPAISFYKKAGFDIKGFAMERNLE